jgi:hypothetical protein
VRASVRLAIAPRQEAAAAGVKVSAAKRVLKLMQALEAAVAGADDGPGQHAALCARIEAAEAGGVPRAMLDAAREHLSRMRVAEAREILEGALRAARNEASGRWRPVSRALITMGGAARKSFEPPWFGGEAVSSTGKVGAGWAQRLGLHEGLHVQARVARSAFAASAACARRLGTRQSRSLWMCGPRRPASARSMALKAALEKAELIMEDEAGLPPEGAAADVSDGSAAGGECGAPGDADGEEATDGCEGAAADATPADGPEEDADLTAVRRLVAGAC